MLLRIPIQADFPLKPFRPRCHDVSVQNYGAVTGSLTVFDGEDPLTLGSGDTAIIRGGELYDVRNRAEVDATLLFISAPALR